MNFFEQGDCTPRGPLSLAKLRQILIRLEDTIIFALIERAQFAHNPIVYEPGKFDFKGFGGSFMEWVLRETEVVHAKVRRYTSPDENPFFDDLPEPIIPALNYPPVLHPNTINENKEILRIYTQEIIPSICRPGDDLQYGSASTRDVECLQALSRRIHCGKFVAEAKFLDPTQHDLYVDAIKRGDAARCEELLTNKAVEAQVVKRLMRKALIYGQDISLEGEVETKPRPESPTGALGPRKIDLNVVVNMYEKYVIPLTVKVEVEYLLRSMLKALHKHSAPYMTPHLPLLRVGTLYHISQAVPSRSLAVVATRTLGQPLAQRIPSEATSAVLTSSSTGSLANLLSLSTARSHESEAPNGVVAAERDEVEANKSQFQSSTEKGPVPSAIEDASSSENVQPSGTSSESETLSTKPLPELPATESPSRNKAQSSQKMSGNFFYNPAGEKIKLGSRKLPASSPSKTACEKIDTTKEARDRGRDSDRSREIETLADAVFLSRSNAGVLSSANRTGGLPPINPSALPPSPPPSLSLPTQTTALSSSVRGTIKKGSAHHSLTVAPLSLSPRTLKDLLGSNIPVSPELASRIVPASNKGHDVEPLSLSSCSGGGDDESGGGRPEIVDITSIEQTQGMKITTAKDGGASDTVTLTSKNAQPAPRPECSDDRRHVPMPGAPYSNNFSSLQLHPATRADLVNAFYSLSSDPLRILNRHSQLLSVNSGVIAMSSPFRGSEIYLRQVVKELASEIGASFLSVVNADVFERGSRNPGGLSISSNGIAGLFANGSGTNDEDEQSVSVPYPWYRGYGEEHLLAFLNLACNVDPAIPKSLHPSQKPNSALPPFVIFWEDFMALLAAQPFHGAKSTSFPHGIGEESFPYAIPDDAIVQALTMAVQQIRKERSLIVVVPVTPTLITRNKSSQGRLEALLGLGGGRRGPGGGPASSGAHEADEEDGVGLGGDDSSERGKSQTRRKIAYDTPFDKYLGFLRINVFPPLAQPPSSKDQSFMDVETFSTCLEEDHRTVIAQHNLREIRNVLKWSDLEGLSQEEVLDLLISRSTTNSEDAERVEPALSLEDKLLTVGEIERLVLIAMGVKERKESSRRTLSEVFTNMSVIPTLSSVPNSTRERVTTTAQEAARSHHVHVDEFRSAWSGWREGLLAAEVLKIGGGEMSTIFKDPRDRQRLNKHEERLLKDCLVQPSKLNVGFTSVGGMQKTKQTVTELIQLPLLRPELFATGILRQTTTGILLFGPPGTGKTMLAKAVATEAGANFLNISMSSIQSMWVGENEKNVKAVFTLARKLRPCVIFVDEVDALLRNRSRSFSPHWAVNTINEFMQEWDGIQSENSGVVVVGATNRPYDLDEAVLRRLPRRILVDLPDVEERTEILTILLRDEQVGESQEERASIMGAVAEKTVNWSGSDLKNLCIASAMNAIRQQILVPNVHGTKRILSLAHFVDVLESGEVVPSTNERAEIVEALRKW
ncbi:hypothetical protein HDU93_007903 [Gonapodya sp. JEL0774]|nr:hypothetical protein HDU93_007903 [Gonapodya sp. JEL0774]